MRDNRIFRYRPIAGKSGWISKGVINARSFISLYFKLPKAIVIDVCVCDSVRLM